MRRATKTLLLLLMTIALVLTPSNPGTLEPQLTDDSPSSGIALVSQDCGSIGELLSADGNQDCGLRLEV